MFCRLRIKAHLQNKKGVALFIVLASMATLAIFVGEITYTAAINQKLAYDRLDQIKAHALAKSGLRLALLRIRAYSEIKKTIGEATKDNKAAADVANSMIPKSILERVWAEPITIPFSGDISALPSAAKDGLMKFRKDSGLEGNLYMSIEAQSSKFNLNTLLPSIAAPPTPTPTPKKPTDPNAPKDPNAPNDETTNPDANTGTDGKKDESLKYDSEKAREQLLLQLQETFNQKFEESIPFRDQYRNLRLDDLAQEIIGWADIGYETLRAQQSTIPFKQAPYYDLSELHFLPSVDDQIYNLIAPQFTASTSQGLNVNSITEAVLRALAPGMNEKERKEFFEFRDAPQPEDNRFKKGEDFIKYLSEKVEAYRASPTKVDDLKKGLAQRGIILVTDETHFKIKIEATIQQTKRTIEAWVSVLTDTKKKSAAGNEAASNSNSNANPETERSNLKITQMRTY